MEFNKHESQSADSFRDGTSAAGHDDIYIKNLNATNIDAVVDLIRRNLGAFEEAGSVLASSFRRTDAMMDTYTSEGSAFIVAYDKKTDRVIGGAGLGPLHGLPLSEGICEIRELVLEESYRGRGIGKILIARCLEIARTFKYQRIYLETTPQMINAQKLFRKFGFRPVTSGPGLESKGGSTDLPCYFLLEHIND